jgi:hypothetical protein
MNPLNFRNLGTMVLRIKRRLPVDTMLGQNIRQIIKGFSAFP